MSKISKNDRVILVSNQHGTCGSNPVLGSKWACTGTVVSVNLDTNFGNPVTVNWDNGHHNVYTHTDLALENANSSRCKTIW